MKKLLLLVLFLSLFILISCVPKEEEHCVEEWDYQMVTKKVTIISYTSYLITTDYGNVEVNKKIYTLAQEGEYSEICLLVDGEEITFIGATLIDGTPLDESIVDEVTDQLTPDEDEE
jgi:hypothetical protein